MSNATARDFPWRAEVSRKVNGTWRMTPKQRRRAVRKHDHSLAPFNAADLVARHAERHHKATRAEPLRAQSEVQR